MKKTRWTPDEIKRVKYLSLIGYTDDEIADKLDRSVKSITAYRRSKRIVTQSHKMGIFERILLKTRMLWKSQ